MPTDSQDICRLYTESKKVRDFNPKDFQKFDVFLLAYSKFLGINPAPEKDQRIAIMNFVKENYGMLSKEEIEKAFNMAVSFKLDITEQQLKTYNMLSPIWISTILNKYITFRGKHVKVLNAQLEIAENEQKRQLSSGDKAKIMIQALMENFQAEINQKEWYDLGSSCFNFMNRNLSLFTIEDIEQAMLEVKDKVVADLNGEAKRKAGTYKVNDVLRELNMVQENSSARLVNTAKRLLLTKWFHDLKDKKLTPLKALEGKDLIL